jgi:replication factor C subunit 3/5
LSAIHHKQTKRKERKKKRTSTLLKKKMQHDEDVVMTTLPPPAPPPSQRRAEQVRGLPWVEKYRPKELEDLIGHEDTIRTITRLVESGTMPHFLLYGPPGTGKTSTILGVARRLYGSSFAAMVLELNASDERGIDVVRSQIKEFASSKKLFSTGLKLVILDEADAMTGAAQAALRRVIEKYTRGTRFALICNHINKIIPAIQSRCTRFRFAPVQPHAVERCIARVSEAEGFAVAADGVRALVDIGRGDMRRVLNVLQATWMAAPAGSREVDARAIYESTGHPTPEDVRRVLEIFLSQSLADAIQHVQDVRLAKGLALQDVLTGLLPVILRLEVDPPAKMRLVDKLAQIECRLAAGCSEKLQLSAMAAAFLDLRLHLAPAGL